MTEERGRIDPDFMPTPHDPQTLAGGEGLRSGSGFGGRGRIPLVAIGAADFDGGQNRLRASEADVYAFSLRWTISERAFTSPEQSRDEFHDLFIRSHLSGPGNTFLEEVSRYSLIRKVSPDSVIPLEALGIDRRMLGSVMVEDPTVEAHESPEYPYGIFEEGPHIEAIERALLDRHTQMTQAGELGLDATEETPFHQRWEVAVAEKYGI